MRRGRQARVVAGPLDLIDVAVADAVDRALDAAPQFQSGRLGAMLMRRRTRRGARRRSCEKVVSACATTWSML